jgi:hypothetical protein
MQNRRSWEDGPPSELEDVWRRKVAVRAFIEPSWSTHAEQIILPSNRCRSRSFVFANGLRFTCNRQLASEATLKGPLLTSHKRG